MLGLHDDGSVLGAQEEAGVVDVGDEIEVLALHLGNGAGADHAGVGEHDIQAAELFHSLGHHVGDRLLVRHVDGDGAGPLAHLPGYLLGQRRVHVSDDNGGAFLIQLLGDALAEALGRTGDDGDLPGQTALARGTVVNVLSGNFLPLGHVDTHSICSFFIMIRRTPRAP